MKPTYSHLTILIVTLILTLTAAAEQQWIKGAMRVLDGDTLAHGKERIRLHGIDAPETGQTCTDRHKQPYDCGASSTAFLNKLKGNHNTRCALHGRGRYGRLIATCYVNDTNLNQAMVQAGWARAYRRYGQEYIKDEAQATARKAGVHQGHHTAPWIYRQQH